MKNKWHDAYMDTALRFSELSSAERLKVGAVIVKDHRIISIGYNGTPHGWSNCCEEPSPDGNDTITKPEVIHAEANAIAKLAKSSESGDGAVMYITHSPCIECAKLILSSGISKVLYFQPYRNDDGILFLRRGRVKCEQHYFERKGI
jgi:dCMP deaminase